MNKFLGVDIGGTKCAVVIGDENGSIFNKIRFETTDYQNTLHRLLQSAERLFTEDVVAIGISCGGPLSSARGLILSPPNLPGWDEVPIVKIFEERFNRPTFLKNDADACAVAEWKWGNGKGYDNLVFLTFGTGMGAGLILNGKPYSGANDMAGEVGHIRLYPSGHWGYGKNGSFEGYCSGGGIAQYGKGSAKEIAEKARLGDQESIELYKKIGNDLGKGISYIVDILNPEAIIIGSIYTRCEDLLKPYLWETLNAEALPHSTATLKILPAGLGEELGDKAALSVAYNGYLLTKENQ